MKVTFLQAPAKALRKIFTNGSAQSYPMVKNFTSHEYELTADTAGLNQKFELIKEHGAKGHALYKGNLTHPLVNESRRGKTDKNELTQSLILDIDGLVLEGITIETPITARQLVTLTESFISTLPRAFHKVSYITQASASMGLKGNALNLHIEFFLDTPTSPRALKDYLVSLNLDCPVAESNLHLSASGMSLCYPIDVCLADNSRILYIAPPEFDNSNDPFASNDDRCEIVIKEQETIDIQPLISELNTESLQQRCREKVKQLRKIQGLPPKRETTQKLNIHGESTTVVTNPDALRLEFVSDNGLWLQFNRAGGTSRGYFVAKNSPNVLRNFKGEDYVLLDVADPDTYNWIVENYAEEISKDGQLQRPFCFRDIESDVMYSGFFDKHSNRVIELNAIKPSNIKDFFAHHGHAEPDIIPQMRYHYTPYKSDVINWQAGFVNKYIMSDLMFENEYAIDNSIDLEFGTAHSDLSKICPVATKIIQHVTGDDPEAFERFVNWVAYIVQTRRKVGTAWLLQGVPGTGKGLVFNSIIRPILGHTNCEVKGINNLDDQFNDWIESSLLVMFDEFQYHNSRDWDALYQRLKPMITDEHLTVRAMRANQRKALSYTNYIFCSNERDPLRITDDDRRFNVAPRQETKLETKYPEIRDEVENDLPNELEALAKFLMETATDRKCATIAWENSAKAIVRETTRTTVEMFIDAIREGDLDFFIPLLAEEAVTTNDLDLKAIVDRAIKNFIRSIDNETPYFLQTSELSHLYSWMHRKTTTPARINKMLQHHGVYPKKQRTPEGTRNCLKVQWKLTNFALGELKEAYLMPSPQTQFAVNQ